MAEGAQIPTTAVEARFPSQEHQFHTLPHYPTPVPPAHLFRHLFHGEGIVVPALTRFHTASQLKAWQHDQPSLNFTGSAQAVDSSSLSTSNPHSSYLTSESGIQTGAFGSRGAPALHDDHARHDQEVRQKLASVVSPQPLQKAGFISYGSSSSSTVPRQDYPCQTFQYIRPDTTSPSTIPISSAPTIHLQPAATPPHFQVFPRSSDPPTGMPTTPSLPHYVTSSFLQCPDLNQLWQSYHGNLLYFWYGLSQQRVPPLPCLSPSDRFLQSHYNGQTVHGGVSLVDTCLLQHLSRPCNYCSPSFPILNVDQIAHGSQISQNSPPTVSAPTTTMPTAAPLWSVPSPLYLFPLHRAVPIETLQTAFPSCAAASEKLSTLFSSLQGSGSSSIVDPSTTLQLSAQSAFGYVKPETHEAACRLKGLPKMSNCIWVNQKQQPTRDLAPKSVGSNQQLNPAAKQDQLEENSIHLCKHQCLAMRTSNCGAPMAAIPAVTSRPMVSCHESLLRALPFHI